MKEKKVILNRQEEDVVYLNNVPDSTPIFAKKDGKLCGLLVNETDAHSNRRWILRLGGARGSNGFHDSREKAIKAALEFEYSFFIVEN